MRFLKVQQKCKVSLPDEAREWLILSRSKLSHEQRALVLARGGGSLKRDEIGRAIRSCYPKFVVPTRKTFGVNLVEGNSDIVPGDNEAESVIMHCMSLMSNHRKGVRS